MSSPCRVAVVGQTPPPQGGQAIMIAAILGAEYDDCELIHVPLAFARTARERGRFSLRKGWSLGRVLVMTWRARYAHGCQVLYYPPSGPSLGPLVRDMMILLLTRWAFQRTILHFHAGGTSEAYERLPSFLRPAFRAAFFNADVGIKTNPLAPPDPERLKARTVVVVPYGIPDPFEGGDFSHPESAGGLRLLYMGVLCESKGVMVLLEACKALHDRGIALEIDLVGGFSSTAFEKEVRSFVASAGLPDRVTLPGELNGVEKHQAYMRADLFCFPSFFEAETFGIVLLEAMAYGLPIVSTRWRGIPFVVGSGGCGTLVPPADVGALAAALETLARSESLRRQMGDAGRLRFEQEFRSERFIQGMSTVLRDVCLGLPGRRVLEAGRKSVHGPTREGAG